MAITKLLRIKENRQSKNKSAGLRRCIEYICQPEKTAGGRLIGGNCGAEPSLIYAEMQANKRLWDKESGSQGYHYVISFSPDETVSDELAAQIAEEFCEELLDGNYLYFYAVHTDKSHAHVHIVFDSVSNVQGTYFHSPRTDWKNRLQPLTDRICERHGLRALSYDPDKERVGMFHAEWESTRHMSLLPPSGATWNDLIRDDIDEATSRSDDWQSFLEEMRKNHYQVRDGKFLSVCPEGKERAVRTGRLGKDYTKEALQERIISGRKELTNGYKTYGRTDILYRAIRKRYSLGRELSPMERKFFIKWVKLSYFRRPDFLHGWRYRSAVVQLEQMTKAFEYMIANDLTDLESVKEKSHELTVKESELIRERIRVRNRGHDQEGLLTERLQEIRLEIQEVHREQKVCKMIMECGMNDPLLFERGSADVVVPPRDFYTRITIDHSLIIKNRHEEETITVRIPGQKESVLLFKEDSRFMNDGRTLSTYLYHDLDYQVVSDEEELIRTISGHMLTGYFEDRTRRKAR